MNKADVIKRLFFGWDPLVDMIYMGVHVHQSVDSVAHQNT